MSGCGDPPAIAMQVIRHSSHALHTGYAKVEATQLKTLIRPGPKCALGLRQLRMEILRRDGPTEATRQHDSELVRRQGTAPAAKLASAHSTVCIQPGVPLLHGEAEHFWKPELALPQ